MKDKMIATGQAGNGNEDRFANGFYLRVPESLASKEFDARLTYLPNKKGGYYLDSLRCCVDYGNVPVYIDNDGIARYGRILEKIANHDEVPTEDLTWLHSLRD